MVRTLIKGLLGVLVVAGLAPFMLPLKDGQPLLSLDDLVAPSLPALPEVDLSSFEGEKPAEPVSVYRWQDATGNVQFSDEPPLSGTPYETVTADPKRNLIRAMESHPEAAPPAKDDDTTPTAEAADTSPAPTPYSAEGVQKLMEDARGVQTLLDDHKKRLDERL